MDETDPRRGSADPDPTPRSDRHYIRLVHAVDAIMGVMHGTDPLRQFGPLVPARAGGQGVVEYGLILALTALFTVVILGVFGGTVSDILSLIANAIDAATGS
jgi:Flp pilus assembly pilin Flp